MTRAPDDQLEVGYVRGVHGVHGALKVQLHAADSDALRPGVPLVFRARGGGAVALRAELIEVAPIKDGYRIRVHSVDSREAAEALKSHGLWIARAELPALADDEYYLADAVGRRVVHVEGEHELGVIESITSNGPQDLFEVCWRNERGKKHRWLLPAVPGMVVAVHPDKIVVDPPQQFMPDALENWLIQHAGGAFAASEPEPPHTQEPDDA